MSEACGYRDDYVLLASCPFCHATHGLRIWQSEESAEADADAESEAA